MSLKVSTHTFQGGMIKDLDKSLVSKERYLDAHNFRLITSTGESTGALENIEGNNLIFPTIAPGVLTLGDTYVVVKGTVTYNAATYTVGQSFTVIAASLIFTGAGSLVVNANEVMPSNMYVAGSTYIRDTIVLFITNNTGIPAGGRSMIVKLTLTHSTELLNTFEVLYDDSLNNSTGTLNFSTLYPIRAVGYYETPTIQKIYWCDDYNNIRYANIVSYLTTDGLVKGVGNFYFAPDLFEFIPNVELTIPQLDYIVAGNISAGIVQYAFQYYTEHGSETTMSPLSNTIHLTNTNDYGTYSVYYKGEGDLSSTAGKGVRLSISVPDSDKYNYIRVVRLHYTTVNSVPTITIVGEVPINSSVTTVTFTDTGAASFGVMTLDQFNIGETELFSAKDLAIKDERLFAANIKKDEFVIGDWDARAVRFRHHAGVPYAVNVTNNISYTGDFLPYASWVDDATIRFTCPNFSTWMGGTLDGELEGSGLPVGTTITAVNTVSFNLATAGNPVILGEYTDTTPTSDIPFSLIDPDYSIPPASISFVGDTLIFEIVSTGGNMFTNFSAFTPGSDYVNLAPTPGDHIVFNIDYTVMITPYTDSAVIGDSISADVPISVPAGDTPAQWDAANWTAYTEDFDGVNYFNDPANDGDADYAYKYQSDGTTLGAEGPYIKIGFTQDDITIDNSNTNVSFYVGTETTSDNKSYTSFASPYLSGRRSWQRDETYRLYIVFFDERGRSSSAQWICDLRMPSLYETGYGVLGALSGTDVYTKALYPTVYIKSFPTGAVAAQLLRVQRTGSDRSILTQALVVPVNDTAGTYRPKAIATAIDNTGQTVKLVSPEINITNNVSFRSGDYLEYVTNYSTVSSTAVTPGILIKKCKVNSAIAYADNNKAVIENSKHVTPSDTAFTFSALSCINYDTVTAAYGSSGLFIHHTNNAWTAGTVNYAVANYKRDVHLSQYGGNTYESRSQNIAIPASGLIPVTTLTTAWNGDTFINYFDVSTQLFDLTKTTLPDTSLNETVYIPLESSINCELRHDRSMRNDAIYTNACNMQEVAGTWTNGDGEVWYQETSLYQYNTVYSQESTAKYYVNVPTTVSTDTEFDCMVRVSKNKYNGESQDSWTLFPVNDFIEVRTNLGPITTLVTINNKLLFWQENAFGVLSVNERSLVQDSGGTLVLGTGGILDRYDYISDSVGASDNQHVVTTQTGVYWLDTRDRSIYRFSQDLMNVSKSKLIQSWLDSQISPTNITNNIIRTVYDQRYNQVLVSFYNSSTLEGSTLVFDETIDAFTGFYDFYTLRFIPYMDGFMSVSHMYNTDFMFYHNSLLKEKCCFYSHIPAVVGSETAGSSKYVNSTIKVLFNDDYNYTKVFDNLAFVSTATVSDVEIYDNTFSSIRCYNNYQNSDYCDLSYGSGPVIGDLPLQRDEREWTTDVPRNAVDKYYPTSPNVFSAANINKLRKFKERIRDKYMITDFVYTNTSNRRFVVPYITIKYRISYR